MPKGEANYQPSPAAGFAANDKVLSSWQTQLSAVAGQKYRDWSGTGRTKTCLEWLAPYRRCNDALAHGGYAADE